MITKFIYGFFGIIALFLITIGKAVDSILPTLWSAFKVLLEVLANLVAAIIALAAELMSAIFS